MTVIIDFPSIKINIFSNAINFRIPEYFDLKGEKLNLLMEMIKERTNMLHENEVITSNCINHSFTYLKFDYKPVN